MRRSKEKAIGEKGVGGEGLWGWVLDIVIGGDILLEMVGEQ